MLDQTILKTIARHHLIREGDRILLGVSGGPDSMALFTFFLNQADNLGVAFAAAHLNHGKRGEESAADQRFVRAHAEKKGIPVFSKTIDLPGILSQWGGNTQEVARRYRYRFFEECAREWNANVIATAHTGSDVVETFLLNLLRGTGARGLSGIPPLRAHNEFRLIRPLIQCAREDVLRYLRAHRIPWREDASNKSSEYSRNRIRHKLIPFLRQDFSPHLEEVVLNSVEILREEDALLDMISYAALEEMSQIRSEGIWVLPLKELRAQPLALRRRILRHAVRSAAGEQESGEESKTLPDFTAVDSLLDLLERPSSGARVDLAGGVVVERSYEEILIYPPRYEFGSVDSYAVPLEIPGITRIEEAGVTIEARLIDRSKTVPFFSAAGERQRKRALFDAEALLPPLVARSRQAGDRLAPLGMEGTKKLKDVFIDEKIPKGQRDEIPLIADEEGILWVVGVKQSERAKITESTRRLLCLEVINSSPSPHHNREDVIA